MPAAPQGQSLPAWPAQLLRPTAQRDRQLPGPAHLPGLLRLLSGRRLECARLRVVAAHHHRDPPSPRQARQGPRHSSEAVVRQGGRVPAPRAHPLPRRLPSRRPRSCASRARRRATHRAKQRGTRRDHPAGGEYHLVRHGLPSGQVQRLGHCLGSPDRPARRAVERQRRVTDTKVAVYLAKYATKSTERSVSRPAGSPLRMRPSMPIQPRTRVG